MKGKFQKMIAGNTPVLVDFYATWCGPCKAVPPILKKTKEALGEDVKIIKIDIDKNKMLANQFKVQAVPTLILFKSGRLVWQKSGVMPANQLIKKIKAVV